MASSVSLDSFCVSAGVEEGVSRECGHRKRPPGVRGIVGALPHRLLGPPGLLVWAGCCLSLPPASPPLVVLIEVPMCSPSRDKPLVETLRCHAMPISAAQGWESWNGRCQISMSRVLVMMSLPSPPCFPSPMSRLAAVDPREQSQTGTRRPPRPQPQAV